MASNDPYGFNNIDDLFDILNSQGRSSFQQQSPTRPQQPAQPIQQETSNSQNSLLTEFGINMTELARQGKLDPVIGRKKELKRTTEILNRRTKNNPVLIGEPGVGKTAVVEALAQAIVSKDVPDKLQNKELIRLDVVSLVQGTGVRGQFEERMQQLMKEVSDREDVILFIDEIHEIMGAGNAEGGMDAGNILKPALARGEFQLIGATTLTEYRQIEKDGAISRRLQQVVVDEPTEQETIKILEGIRPKYESYHQVKYSDDTLKAAVTLSTRYVPERFLPDKAIDLIDEAGSRKNLNVELTSPEEIQNKINSAESMKQQSIEKEDFEKASFWRDQVSKLEKQKETAEKSKKSSGKDATTVRPEDLMAIIEDQTNIPVGQLKEDEASQLKDLASNLEKNVIGQNQAVDKVAKAVRRNRIGLTKSGRPIGSFLFVGPTGVGKTETAKQLAKDVFGSEDAMIRFDMSEYMEKHSVSQLIGSPAGYVGYEDSGQLTEQVRRNPYSLILLDEIEKAHPDVLNMFLQILDDGRLTDSHGITVSFKDTIIIATSNAGASNPLPEKEDEKEEEISITEKLTNYFRPEFLNRFDAIVEYKPLSKENLLKITELMINSMNSMLSENNIHVDVDEAAQKKIVEIGYVPSMGARPLRRVIQEQIEDQVADVYLDNPKATDMKATVNEKGDIVVSASKSK